jgi:hypothetical protein
MATIPSLCLVGVRKDQLDSFGKPRFLGQLQSQFRGRDLKGEGRPALIRNVPYPDHIRDLQNQYGREYVQFYYVDEPLMKAIKQAEINLQFLHLVFGSPEGADVYATISLPAAYWD